MHKKDLVERTFQFAVRIIKFIKTIKYSKENDVIKYQLAKAGTSIGANYEEAQGAYSKDDFKFKIGICFKESKEHDGASGNNAFKEKMPDDFKIYFWDVEWENLNENLQKYKSFVVARLADKGDCEVVKWLKARFSVKEISGIVTGSRTVSEKTCLFWERYGQHV